MCQRLSKSSLCPMLPEKDYIHVQTGWNSSTVRCKYQSEFSQTPIHPFTYLSSSTLQLVQWKCFAAWPPNSYKNRSLGPFPCWSYLGVAVSPEGSHTTFWNHRFHGKFSALKTSSKKFVNIVFNIESNTHSYIHHIQYSFCHLSWLHDVPPQGRKHGDDQQ